MNRTAADTKVCPGCNKGLPRTEEFFAKVRRNSKIRWKDGLYPRCKECVSKYQKQRYALDSSVKARTLLSNRKRQLARYGLTVEDYDEMLRQQEGACAICKEPPSEGWKLAVDHDHKTGKVRGLLCLGCNVTVGYLEENPIRIQGCQAYLEKHGQ